MKAPEQASFFRVSQNEYKKSHVVIKTENWIKIAGQCTSPQGGYQKIQEGWLRFKIQVDLI